MSWLRVSIEGRRTAFRPGDVLRGEAAWHLDGEPEKLSARLFWYTQGKGTQDVGVVEELELSPVAEGRQELRFQIPEGPYSFSGKLVSLLWAVELVAEPGGETARAELVVSPTGRELVLVAPEEPPP